MDLLLAKIILNKHKLNIGYKYITKSIRKDMLKKEEFYGWQTCCLTTKYMLEYLFNVTLLKTDKFYSDVKYDKFYIGIEPFERAHVDVDYLNKLSTFKLISCSIESMTSGFHVFTILYHNECGYVIQSYGEEYFIKIKKYNIDELVNIFDNILNKNILTPDFFDSKNADKIIYSRHLIMFYLYSEIEENIELLDNKLDKIINTYDNKYILTKI